MKKTMYLLIVLLLMAGMTACAAPAAGQSPAAATQAETQPSKELSQEPSQEPSPEPSAVPATETVVFGDEVLEALVRKEMKKPEGDITIADAEAVENLVLKENDPSTPSPRIKDISALKYFKNLKGLDISYQMIEDLSPLAGLTKLEALQYWGAESAKNFSALAGMTNMLDLLIADSPAFGNDEMNSLAGMTKIEMIWIQDTKALTDISVVANFKHLQRLNVDFTGVSDISPAAGLTTLVEVNLEGSKVSDVSPLKNLVNLKKLFLKDCPVTDLSPLKDIYPNLEQKDFELK